MSLRYEIANLLSESYNKNTSQWADADAILALPSGLVAVKECKTHKEPEDPPWGECPYCHGTGRIVRNMTVVEAIEQLKLCIKGVSDSHGEPYRYYAIITPSGERVEVKK